MRTSVNTPKPGQADATSAPARVRNPTPYERVKAQLETVTGERDNLQQTADELAAEGVNLARRLGEAHGTLETIKREALALARATPTRHWLTGTTSIRYGLVMEHTISIVDAINKYAVQSGLGAQTLGGDQQAQAASPSIGGNPQNPPA